MHFLSTHLPWIRITYKILKLKLLLLPLLLRKSTNVSLCSIASRLGIHVPHNDPFHPLKNFVLLLFVTTLLPQ